MTVCLQQNRCVIAAITKKADGRDANQTENSLYETLAGLTAQPTKRAGTQSKSESICAG